MNIKQLQIKFTKELELFLELWRKTSKQDPKDFKRLVDDFMRRAKAKNLISITYSDVNDREALAVISKQIYNDFSKLGEKYGEKVYDILREGVKTDTPRDVQYKRAMREIKKGKQYAYTWINTSENAVNQASRLTQNIEQGVTRFKYVGPPADREFCQRLLGKTFTIKEIEQMDHGQGLPVLYYRGGYNCRHRWQPVDGEEENTKKNAIEPVAPGY